MTVLSKSLKSLRLIQIEHLHPKQTVTGSITVGFAKNYRSIKGV